MKNWILALMLLTLSTSAMFAQEKTNKETIKVEKVSKRKAKKVKEVAIDTKKEAQVEAKKAVDQATDAVKEEKVGGPVMHFETKTVDYGTIKKGSDPIRIITFSNTGNEPLIIKHAKGSCGCTVPTAPKEPILPGESSQIEIRYDTKRVGPIRKTVRITTNEGDQPHILQVRGTIEAEPVQEALPVKKDGLLNEEG